MVDFTEQRIQELEDKVHALQQLLLAHVVAFDAVDRNGTDAALAIAASQIDAAGAIGRRGAALRLKLLVEAIQDAQG